MPLNYTTVWQPGHWCVAMLQVCEQHITDGDSEDELFRYPEQWMYTLWRPSLRFLPFNRPDAFGLTIGKPHSVIEEQMATQDADATLYVVETSEWLWSSWLSIPLLCDRLEPWLVRQIQSRIGEQRAAESGRYLQWYGSREADFQRFLRNLSGEGEARASGET